MEKYWMFKTRETEGFYYLNIHQLKPNIYAIWKSHETFWLAGAKWLFFTKGLNYYDLVTPYGDIDLGQHWLR